MLSQPGLSLRSLRRSTFVLMSIMVALLVLLTACGDATTAPATSASAAAQVPPTANLNVTEAATAAPVKATAPNGTITIRISYPGAQNTGNGQIAARFATLASQNTNGRVQVQVFPNSSVAGGDQLTAVNMVESNKVEAVISQAYFFTTIDPSMEVLGYPFLFANRNNALNFFNGDGGKQLLATLEQFNFKTVAFGDQGFRQLSNSKRPVATPGDLAALKVRIPQSNLYTKVFKALGAEPVTMNFSPELYKALQNKTLDGQDAPINFSASNKYYEVQPYFTVLNYSWDPLLLTFSLNFWNSLPADIQKGLSDAGAQVTKEFNNTVDETEKAALDQFRKSGVQVTVLSPAQTLAFADLTKPLYTAAATQFGKDFMDKIVKAAQNPS